MLPDIEEYRLYLKHLDISDDRKDEVIHTVYRIMESFVDRAFSNDAVQLASGSELRKDADELGPVIELEKYEYQELGLSDRFNMKKGD